MTFHQLRCPNCNADLEIEGGVDTFFCKYCGTKIIVDGQSDVTIRAKADIKLGEQEIKRRQMEYEYKERKLQEAEKSRRRILYISIGFAALLWILFFFA